MKFIKRIIKEGKDFRELSDVLIDAFDLIDHTGIRYGIAHDTRDQFERFLNSRNRQMQIAMIDEQSRILPYDTSDLLARIQERTYHRLEF